MSSDHIESWRTYLVEQMQERQGVETQEAQTSTDRWLRSLEGDATSAVAEESTEREGTE
jgi:hypothetical protein